MTLCNASTTQNVNSEPKKSLSSRVRVTIY